jgi:predicted nucleotidyltransferase
MTLERVKTPPVHNPYSVDDFMSYEFFRKLCAFPFVQKVCLYGSRARGTHRPDSDIDFMVYCDPKTSRQQWLEVCEVIRHADITLGIDCMRHSDTAASILLDFRDKRMDFRTLYVRPDGA